MSWFKNEPPTTRRTLELPPGYSFEFEVQTNVPNPTWGVEYPMAVFDWDLFFNGEHVDEGAYNIFMSRKNIDQILFCFARTRAFKHKKKMGDTLEFPYDTTARHVLPASMVIENDILNEYHYE